MMRFAHTNIIAFDWKKLRDFYVKTFECKVVPPYRNQSGGWLDKGTGLKNAKLEGVHLLLPGYQDKGPTLEIYQYEMVESQKESLPNTRGFRHIAFEVNSVSKTLSVLIDNGGKSFGQISVKEIKDVGILTFVYAIDPEGNLIELQSWDKQKNQI